MAGEPPRGARHHKGGGALATFTRMDVEEWEVILRKTAQDSKVSGGERAVLKEKIREAALDAHSRAVLRARAFDIARDLALHATPRGAVDWLEEIVKLLLPPT